MHADTPQFVDWFRSSSPYINAFRGRTFVIVFGGEVISEQRFTGLAHDIALLNSLGIRLVLVHGSRPQIEQRLRERKVRMQYVRGLRITDKDSLECVKEAAGVVSVEIEAMLSMGLANTPMAGARIRVASGNFVTAQPLGILEGIDHLYTGKVRRIDHQAIQQQLDGGAIVLLSPIGYSPTGEVFNLTALEVASATAVALKADKILYLVEAHGLEDANGRLLRELTPSGAERELSGKPDLPQTMVEVLRYAVESCRSGVRRAHLIDHRRDGALLLELFTRDGIGTMISTDLYEGTRQATIEDVGGILTLIAPLEREGILVRRSREHLEIGIGQFTVIERDGMVIACAAFQPFAEERVGELACLAVHPDYRHNGHGEALLRLIESEARKRGIDRLFVLTTHASHWFQERGFQSAEIGRLPVARQAMYNYQRNSQVLIKTL
ncbi:MAG: amino-acid N-acetyltransferase [Gammaproteobacteria bacterium]|nr:amino-acid N-acetyltransferase [Gammaproteobacteria bacterium]